MNLERKITVLRFLNGDKEEPGNDIDKGQSDIGSNGRVVMEAMGETSFKCKECILNNTNAPES